MEDKKVFTDLFEELAKEAAKPVQNPEDRKVLAAGYSRHAELRVVEMLKTLLSAAEIADDRYLIELLSSRIREMEEPHERAGE